jgi:uncharacterized protein YbjT (DUF2867 family)
MPTQKKIAVAGATGRIGRHIVDVLKERGHDAVAISRSNGVDVITRAGLAEALACVDGIIDALNGPATDPEAAMQFFTTAARNLQDAGAQAGVQGIVVLSIIGIDRFSSGYYAAKLAQERVALAGPLPALILRAAQFHEFVEQSMGWGRQGDVCTITPMRTQLVAARTAAEALVDLATDPQSAFARFRSHGPIFEIAGPREENLVEAAKRFAAKRGDPVRIEAANDPTDQALYDAGALLPDPHAVLAGPTFDEWLDAMM